MSARIAVVVFPGTNCEHDTVEGLAVVEATGTLVWHDATSLEGYDGVILPGGFAHGDYLRTGAIARFSPIMGAVADFARGGGPVLGICNGFQVLCEAGLLPGALQKNAGLSFRCEPTDLRVETTRSPLTSMSSVGDVLSIPINHFEGSYAASPETLDALRADDRVLLRYVRNPNGSMDDIAGVCNEERNVVGLMPHPERATSDLLGSTDGVALLAAFAAAAAGPGATARVAVGTAG